MSAAVYQWAWDQNPHNASAKLVLLYCAWLCLDDEVWVSVAELAANTGLSNKTVRAAIKRLIEAGLLKDTGYRDPDLANVRGFLVGGAA